MRNKTADTREGLTGCKNAHLGGLSRIPVRMRRILILVIPMKPLPPASRPNTHGEEATQQRWTHGIIALITRDAADGLGLLREDAELAVVFGVEVWLKVSLDARDAFGAD